MAIRILNLDLGKTGCGWAVKMPAAIESGVQSFKLRRGESPGMLFVNFRAWLNKMIDAFAIELVCYEMPLHGGGASTEVLFGLATKIQEILAERELAGQKINFVSQNQGSIKKHVTTWGDAKKDEVTRWAAAKLGVDIAALDHNRGDAVALCSLSEYLYNQVEETVRIDNVQRTPRAAPGESASRWSGRKKKGKKAAAPSAEQIGDIFRRAA